VSEPRLASHVEVAAFIKLANAGGDFATVIRKGDPTSGVILLIGLVRGQNPRLYERFPALDGPSLWQEASSEATDSQQKITDYCTRRVARDPDIWILELDVAEPERLTGYLGQNC
jgi:hypothetical protein